MHTTRMINLSWIGLLMSISCSSFAKETTLITIADANTSPAVYIDLPSKGDTNINLFASTIKLPAYDQKVIAELFHIESLLYPNHLKMQDSAGIKTRLGKALS
ncbi:hypothetical protein [uncultured Shewanella sp.]|uniref:hypothetical protein n=1 Tax=uncultured Shewanella sp. TaxID=173975 RepID=UPI002628F496|nr:hypothetical protein [uncultured Shewanella sp.]